MKKVNQKQYVPALKWIVKLLKKEKIKFNILGGLAAYVYGSKRIINDVQGINRVMYDFTSKPPGTIEWE